jgi:Flp pilus assembly pilin Flp
VNTKSTPRQRLKQWRGRGQGLVEYAMIIALIVIVVIIMLSTLGGIVFVNYYSKIGSSMNGVVR